MNAIDSTHKQNTLVLYAETAEDLMTKNPISVRHDATIREAAAFLVEKEISGAPVVDDAGRAVGVISRADFVRLDSEACVKGVHDTAYYRDVDCRCPPAFREFVYGKRTETLQVRDVMSPVVIQVFNHDSALSAVAKLRALKIHRLFVTDDAGTLIGVISALDVLRCLGQLKTDGSGRAPAE